MKNAPRVVGLLVLLVSVELSFAGSLNLVKKYPDIFASGLTVDYNSISKLFSVGGTGLSMTFDLNGGAPEYMIASTTPPNAYALSAHIDNAGMLLDGTLSISGSLRSVLAPAVEIFNGNLLSGNLYEFGHRISGNGAIFEFRFAVTGGFLFDPKLFYTDTGGIIISAPGSAADPFGPAEFTDNFRSSAQADTFVPAPAALPAGVGLLVGMLAYGACRKKVCVSAFT